MEIFTEQIERAAAENKDLIIMGDANLCSEKWESPNFKHKRIADELKETLTQCGLKIQNLGKTYLADRLNPDGEEIESCLDHIYTSKLMRLGLPNRIDVVDSNLKSESERRIVVDSDSNE